MQQKASRSWVWSARGFCWAPRSRPHAMTRNSSPCLSCQLNLMQPERPEHPEDSCALRRGRNSSIQRGRDAGFQLRRFPTAMRPWRAPPFRFASSLRRVATQVAASLSKYRAASYDLAAPAERRCWLASVGIGLGLLRSSILRCCAVYYPRGSTSVATSLRSPRPLSQCQNLPASTEPHFLTIAIRSRALPHSWASPAAKKKKKKRPSATPILQQSTRQATWHAWRSSHGAHGSATRVGLNLVTAVLHPRINGW